MNRDRLMVRFAQLIVLIDAALVVHHLYYGYYLWAMFVAVIAAGVTLSCTKPKDWGIK